MLQPYLQNPTVVAVGFLEGKWLSSLLTPFVVSRKKTKALGWMLGQTCSARESQCRVLPNATLPLWITGQPCVRQRSDETQQIGWKPSWAVAGTWAGLQLSPQLAAALGTQPCAVAAGDSVSSTALQERSFPYTEVFPIWVTYRLSLRSRGPVSRPHACHNHCVLLDLWLPPSTKYNCFEASCFFSHCYCCHCGLLADNQVLSRARVWGLAHQCCCVEAARSQICCSHELLNGDRTPSLTFPLPGVAYPLYSSQGK